jgi:hypothetical protein
MVDPKQEHELHCLKARDLEIIERALRTWDRVIGANQEERELQHKIAQLVERQKLAGSRGTDPVEAEVV